MLQEGLASLKVLGASFAESVFLRRVKTTQSPHGAPACFDAYEDAATRTRFFLNPINDGDDPCAGSDWVVLFVMFLVIHCFSWWSRWLLWEPLARWHLGIPNMNRLNSATLKKVENFSQSVNAASFHTLSSVFAFRILRNKDWMWSTEEWFDADSLSFIEADFKFYYLLYAARYVSDMLSLWFEHPRSDTAAFAIHHAATVSIVLFSAQTGATRIGGVIMFFFDWADPPLLVAKALLYLSRTPTDIYQFCADRLFEAFAVAFFVTRTLMFNYVVYECFSYDTSKYFQISVRDVVLLRSMLLVLVALMTFWLVLIIKAALKQSSNKGNVEDIREDDHKKKRD